MRTPEYFNYDKLDAAQLVLTEQDTEVLAIRLPSDYVWTHPKSYTDTTDYLAFNLISTSLDLKIGYQPTDSYYSYSDLTGPMIDLKDYDLGAD